jgi:hypothetical protein
VIEGKYTELHRELSDNRSEMRSNTEMILGYIRRYSEDREKGVGSTGAAPQPPSMRRER